MLVFFPLKERADMQKKHFVYPLSYTFEDGYGDCFLLEHCSSEE